MKFCPAICPAGQLSTLPLKAGKYEGKQEKGGGGREKVFFCSVKIQRSYVM